MKFKTSTKRAVALAAAAVLTATTILPHVQVTSYATSFDEIAEIQELPDDVIWLW